MKPHERNWARLPLEGATNVRELGGYPTMSGGQTRYHRFLRSDGLDRLTKADEAFLYGYGVRSVIDLRDAAEASDAPDRQIAPDVVHVSIPLLDFNAAETSELRSKFDEGSFFMRDIYQRILENYEGVRAVFRFLADAPKGCVLFHCAVGKDRTGILAMLLLSLAGVDRWDIVANYIQTWPNLMRDEAFRSDWYASSGSVFREGMTSDAGLIEFALDLMETEHGSVEDFLLECGVPDDDVAAVRARLL